MYSHTVGTTFGRFGKDLFLKVHLTPYSIIVDPSENWKHGSYGSPAATPLARYTVYCKSFDILIWKEIIHHMFIISFLVNKYTGTILALFGKVKVLILLLMAFESDLVKTPEANLTSLVGILSIEGAFLEFRDFRMVLISFDVLLEPQLEEGIEIELNWKFLFSRVFTWLGWFLYSSKVELNTPFFLLDAISNSNISSLMSQDRSTMLNATGLLNNVNVMIAKNLH